MLNLEQLTQDTRQALQGLLAAANLSGTSTGCRLQYQ